MDVRSVLKSQYHASFEMLRQAIEKCPASMWNDDNYRNEFWHIAYHALFYTHLYLQPSEEAFEPWTPHRDQYNFMGPLPWPPHDEPQIGEPYRKEEILAYYAYCRETIDETVDSLDLDGDSGFYWIPLSKLELQFYNIRHLQHHTGELCERLGAEAHIDIGWVGNGYDSNS